MESSRARRLDGVDALRGLAILFVLMNHVNMRLLIGKVPYGHSLPRQVLSSLVWNGQYGVQIFFAVSGFLITSTSLRRWGRPADIHVRDFYRLRFARIAPLLLLLLTVLCALHFTGSRWFVVSARTGGLGRALFAALTFHVNVLEARRGYLPGNWDILWSLSVEEVFYFFFPLVFAWLGRGWGLPALLGTLVAAGPFARTFLSYNEVWREYSYLGGMDAIAMGCLTALLFPRLWRPRQPALWLAAGLAMMILVLGFSITGQRLGLVRTGLDMSIVASGTCLVIAAAAQLEWRGGRMLGPLLWLGRRSYEIYLTHMFVVIGFFVAFTRLGDRFTGVPALFLLSVLVAGLLGEAVARFYSDPVNRALRRGLLSETSA